MADVKFKSGDLKGKWTIGEISFFRARSGAPWQKVEEHFNYGEFVSIGDYNKGVFGGIAALKTRGGEYVEVSLGLAEYETISERIKNAHPSSSGIRILTEWNPAGGAFLIAALMFLPISFKGCGSSGESEKGKVAGVGSSYGQLVEFTVSDVCRAAISVELGRPVNGIKAKSDGGIYRVWYVRKFDGERFDYRCKLMAGNSVVWATYPDGRWRDGSNGFTHTDQVINYSENPATGSLDIYVNGGLVESLKKANF